MPNKHNAAHRHHIAKMKFRVTNWAEYEAGLRRRGSLTLWITPEALANWRAPRRRTPGGQPRYSDLAIETTLMLGCAFGMLRLRQTEGLMNSVIDLMGLDLPVPDHTTLGRRAQKQPIRIRFTLPDGPLHVLADSTGLKVYGAGQWLQEKHGAKSRRNWRKLHLAVDADSGRIVAHTLTDQDTDDPSQVVIPPRSKAVQSSDTGPPGQRDSHITAIAERGRLNWQAATGYGKRALIETTMGRYKALIGPRLRARCFTAQQTEVAIGCAVLNRMLATGRPDSVRRKNRQP
jgi:hypothetical protein